MSTANRGMSDIKTIREALEFGAGWFIRPNSAFQVHSPSEQLFKDALAALSRLAEPGEDARELVYRIWQIVTQGDSTYWAAKEPEAAALIERYVAAQVAKAREEERERVENAIRSWILRGQYGGVDALIATIKEAPDGTN